MFVGEDEEAPGRISGESSEAIVDRNVLVLSLLKDDREKHDSVHGWVLEQVNLAENDIGVENDNRRRRRVEREASIFGVAA